MHSIEDVFLAKKKVSLVACVPTLLFVFVVFAFMFRITVAFACFKFIDTHMHVDNCICIYCHIDT